MFMGEPTHISIIIKEVLTSLSNKSKGQSSGKMVLSKLRSEIRKKQIRKNAKQYSVL